MSYKHRIALRADGSIEIGMGHIMRCLALAQMLRDKYDVSFVLSVYDDFVLETLNKNRIDSIKIQAQLDSSFANAFDAVVVDGYWYTNHFIKQIKNLGVIVIQIDDLCGQDFFSDIVINHAIGANYSNSSLYNVKHLLTGISYALIREEFIKEIGKAKINNDITSITINMGGSDPSNYTLKVLRAIINIKYQGTINVLVGKSYPHLKKLTEITANSSINVFIGLDVFALIKLLKNTSLFICSASTIIYEALALNTPTAFLLTANNQKNIYSGLVSLGNSFPLGNIETLDDHKLSENISTLINNYNSNFLHNNINRQVIDGLAGDRINSAIASLWT